ncbi:MAG: hypothetical protein Q9159_000309 [Coniocarpon cinnabarinum]
MHSFVLIVVTSLLSAVSAQIDGNGPIDSNANRRRDAPGNYGAPVGYGAAIPTTSTSTPMEPSPTTSTTASQYGFSGNGGTSFSVPAPEETPINTPIPTQSSSTGDSAPLGSSGTSSIASSLAPPTPHAIPPIVNASASCPSGYSPGKPALASNIPYSTNKAPNIPAGLSQPPPSSSAAAVAGSSPVQTPATTPAYVAPLSSPVLGYGPTASPSPAGQPNIAGGGSSTFPASQTSVVGSPNPYAPSSAVIGGNTAPASPGVATPANTPLMPAYSPNAGSGGSQAPPFPSLGAPQNSSGAGGRPAYGGSVNPYAPGASSTISMTSTVSSTHYVTVPASSANGADNAGLPVPTVRPPTPEGSPQPGTQQLAAGASGACSPSTVTVTVSTCPTGTSAAAGVSAFPSAGSPDTGAPDTTSGTYPASVTYSPASPVSQTDTDTNGLPLSSVGFPSGAIINDNGTPVGSIASPTPGLFSPAPPASPYPGSYKPAASNNDVDKAIPGTGGPYTPPTAYAAPTASPGSSSATSTVYSTYKMTVTSTVASPHMPAQTPGQIPPHGSPGPYYPPPSANATPRPQPSGAVYPYKPQNVTANLPHNQLGAHAIAMGMGAQPHSASDTTCTTSPTGVPGAASPSAMAAPSGSPGTLAPLPTTSEFVFGFKPWRLVTLGYGSPKYNTENAKWVNLIRYNLHYVNDLFSDFIRSGGVWQQGYIVANFRSGHYHYNISAYYYSAWQQLINFVYSFRAASRGYHSSVFSRGQPSQLSFFSRKRTVIKFGAQLCYSALLCKQ